MIAAIDFDGTLVEHMFPEIGPEVPDAFDWLHRFEAGGVRLMLWTMRSGYTLDRAVEFCRERGVEFWGVNESRGQRAWSISPKQYAHVYIDDAALGCPLCMVGGNRPVVDWAIAGPMAMRAFGLEFEEGVA